MTAVAGSIQLGSKDQTWFDANPTLVLKDGQVVFLKGTRLFKIGDGVAELDDLRFSNVFPSIIMESINTPGSFFKFTCDDNGMLSAPGEPV